MLDLSGHVLASKRNQVHALDASQRADGHPKVRDDGDGGFGRQKVGQWKRRGGVVEHHGLARFEERQRELRALLSPPSPF